MSNILERRCVSAMEDWGGKKVCLNDAWFIGGVRVEHLILTTALVPCVGYLLFMAVMAIIHFPTQVIGFLFFLLLFAALMWGGLKVASGYSITKKEDPNAE